jgi:protein SCO1
LTRALAAALALAAVLTSCRSGRRDAGLPVLFELPAFTLVERSGRPFTLDDLRGRVAVADFVFTRCAGVCPNMTARMSKLRQALPDEVRLVTFTVDPGHDTPAVLTRYAEPLEAGQRWLFVTGRQADVHRLATDGFKLAAMEAPPGGATDDGPFLHSAKFALLDARARVRGYYDSDDPEAMTALARDARRLCGEER